MQCNALKHLRSIYGLYKKYIIITPVIFYIIQLITNHKNTFMILIRRYLSGCKTERRWKVTQRELKLSQRLVKCKKRQRRTNLKAFLVSLRSVK